jgi:hypothetical protein
MNTEYDFEERVSICMESGLSQPEAEEVAARDFFRSCNRPTKEQVEHGYSIGWTKLKTFRMMNRGGLEQWK